jgi:hypothetical protein
MILPELIINKALQFIREVIMAHKKAKPKTKPKTKKGY